MADKIAQLVEVLENANRMYRSGEPIMDDGEYDALEDQLRSLDPDHPFLHQLNDDDPFVGVDTNRDIPDVAFEVPDEFILRFNTPHPHTITMGSQQKALSLNDPNLASFIEDVESELLFYSDKVDGASAEATYQDGKLVRVLTRGDGAIGVDITAPCWLIPGLPRTLPIHGRVVVRGEVCMRKSEFPKLNRALVAAGRDPVKNTRNGTVGIIKTLKNLPYAAYLDFLAFDLLFPDVVDA